MLAVPALLQAALAGAIWPWTVLSDRRRGPRFLMTLIATSAGIVVLQVALGMTASLASGPLLRATVALVGVLAAGWWGFGRRMAGRRLAAGTLANQALPEPMPTGRGGFSLGVLTGVVYLILIAISAIVPPYGWDTLVYHLTDVFQAVNTRTLGVFPFPGRNFFYPTAGELHSLWYYLLSGGGDQAWRVTGIGLAPLGLTAGVAARVGAQALGAKKALFWIAPAVMLLPIVMIQPLAGYVDVAFAAFTLAAFAFALLAAPEGRLSQLFWCALSGGLAMGVKISFLYFSLPVVIVLMSRPVLRALIAGSMRTRLVRLAALAAFFFVGCGFWMGRNFIQTGNPIYPTAVRFAGRTILPGPSEISASKKQQGWFVPSTGDWARYPFYETFAGKPAYTLENGFGPLFAAGLIASLMALAIALARRKWLFLRSLVAIPVTVALWLTINPYQEPRYIIAVAGFALITMAVLVEMMAAAGARKLVHASVIVAVLFSAAGGIATATPHLPQAIAGWRAGGWSPEKFYGLEYGPAGEAFSWLSENSKSGKNVSFTNGAFIAPLFGWHARNRVSYARVPGDSAIDNAPRTATYRSWRRYLHDGGTEWVVQWIPWWEGEGTHRTEEWIASHPEAFELLKEIPGRAKIFRPVFTADENASFSAMAAAGVGERGLPDIAEFCDTDAFTWTLEYKTGTDMTFGPDPARPGSIHFDYEFKSADNDYADIRVDLEDSDWSRAGVLSFDVELPEVATNDRPRTVARGSASPQNAPVIAPAPTYLFLYLKNRDPHEYSRYQVDLLDAHPGINRMTIDLTLPQARSNGFSFSKMGEAHFVIDDADDHQTGRASLSLSNFRLARSGTTS